MQSMLDQNAFDDRRLVVVGHSLGGSLANMIGEEFDGTVAETHAFNPGGSIRTRHDMTLRHPGRKRKRTRERKTEAYGH